MLPHSSNLIWLLLFYVNSAKKCNKKNHKLMELSILSSFKVCRKKFCDICKMLEKILCKPIVTVMMTVCWENFEAYGANVMRLLFAIFFFFWRTHTNNYISPWVGSSTFPTGSHGETRRNPMEKKIMLNKKNWFSTISITLCAINSHSCWTLKVVEHFEERL